MSEMLYLDQWAQKLAALLTMAGNSMQALAGDVAAIEEAINNELILTSEISPMGLAASVAGSGQVRTMLRLATEQVWPVMNPKPSPAASQALRVSQLMEIVEGIRTPREY
jgi:hypothetical protein